MIALQHIPSFFDTDKRERGEFSSVDELLSIPWVKSWSDDPTHYRYSIVVSYDNEAELMVEHRGGRWWWVVAHLRGDGVGRLGLPKWRAIK